MSNFRTIHAVSIGSNNRKACWYMDASLADAQYDALVSHPGMVNITVSRFELEVPAVALPTEISLMVDEANFAIQHPGQSAFRACGHQLN